MNRIALISDSTCDLPKEIVEKYNVRILPFLIIYKDREYLDGLEITPEEVYARLREEVPTTALPSLKGMHDLYRSLIADGYTHAIFITLSSGLSGIYNAAELVCKDYPQIQSFVYDSKSISWGEGILVEAAGKMIEEGRSFEEIVRTLPELTKRSKIFFVVGTLEYLKRGGRIGTVVATISELLQVKPIISIGTDGKYFTHDKVRGRKQSLNRMIETGKELLAKKKCRIYVMSGDAQEEAEQVLQELKKHPNVISAQYGGTISPVSGVHSGPGLVGVLFVEEPA